MPYEPIIPKGQHLGTSRDVADAVTGHLFDGSNHLVGQAAWRHVDEPTESEDEARTSVNGATPMLWTAVGVSVGVVGTLIAVRYRSQLKRAWSRLSRTTQPELSAEAETEAESAFAGITVADFSNEVQTAVEDFATVMDSEEAQARLAAILAAGAFIAEQMRMLSNARISDSSELPELQNALAQLSTQRVVDGMNRMLESKADLLDEHTSELFMRYFGGGRLVDGEYVPLTSELVDDALRLDPYEEGNS